MKNFFCNIVLFMKTFSHVVISKVTRMQLRKKNDIFDYITKKWSIAIFVLE